VAGVTVFSGVLGVVGVHLMLCLGHGRHYIPLGGI
jgi:hypothetical protein